MSEYLELDGGVESAPVFGRQLQESIRWFLINGTDLLPHLEDENLEGTLYVGRRVEPCWRAIERFSDNWVERHGEYDGDLVADLARLKREAARVPALPGSEASTTSWARCAHGAFEVAGDAINRLEPCRNIVPVQMRIARHAYAAFRIAKYNWVAEGTNTTGLSDMPPYLLEY